ncbi:Vps53-like protein [Zopfochytrium polystomum]|nr:Vps53-like protein [Zopfochytrium polystomum]
METTKSPTAATLEPSLLPVDQSTAAQHDAVAEMDPLDSRAFDPVQYINLIFPNEQSLTKIDAVLEKLKLKMEDLDAEVSYLVREQTDGATVAAAEIEQCKSAIRELFERIRLIREKASSSEQMVQDITRDIKSLDQAKKNLVTSISTIKRLQMLAASLDYIKLLAQRRQYLETSQLLQVIMSLITDFETFRNVAQIAVLFERVKQLEVDLRRQIFSDFEGAFVGGALRKSIDQLNEGCLLVDVLGQDVREQLCTWYCDLQLKDYRSIFKQNPEVAGLDSVNRRYSWLKRLLKSHDEEHAPAFPPQWKMAELLCERFCLQTRRDLSEVLAANESTLDVKVMLTSLQQTIEFEQKVSGRFDVNNEFGEPPLMYKFKAIISSCFEPYLRLYIESEDKTLSAMMDAYRQSTVMQEDDYVLQSSTDLFLFYRQTLVQCSKLSTNKPFLDLCRLFGKWLRVYADVLTSKLPRDDKRTYSEEDLRLACLVINTADYCSDTCGQLEEKLIEKIDEKLKSTVSFSQEIEGFIGVTGSAIKSLVVMVETLTEPALTAMTRRSWGNIDSVGDQSEYVTQIGNTIVNAVNSLKSALTGPKYFKMFCDKFAEYFFSKFHSNIFKCRPISEVGAEQMLLDTHALKTALIQMAQIFNATPSAGGGGGDKSEPKQPLPATYLKILGRGVLRVEQLLKVVLRTHEPPSGIVETFILLFPDGDYQQLQKILELKGLKRSEQQPVLEAFQQRIGATGGTKAGLAGDTRPRSGSTGFSSPFVPAGPRFKLFNSKK